ncbi:hypothetical protein [Novosphingobium album (ex Liu et al. 2023)]|uniref:SLATT domain-containing protein n=1 Tax=Novosphingobium album (ex Liu et al. 2023) TaxID=3031130 RepID=A0ABT5WUD4_9SPHN|nr:hypothetical protein [Novosphingobium album (ex Liu et al. 2023)]MDE8653510.1 hypothetical protein [Novosphingobium album (ex Liu et al. 2023)]
MLEILATSAEEARESANFASFLDMGANFAAIAGMIGLIIAWVSYKHSVSLAMTSSMNALFRDYLRLEYDSLSDARADGALSDEAVKVLHSYKMWVMEEIFLWNDRRWRRWFVRSTIPCGVRFDQRFREMINWDATIIFHINNRQAVCADELVESRSCYSPGFIAFCVEWQGKEPSDYENQMRSFNAARREARARWLRAGSTPFDISSP